MSVTRTYSVKLVLLVEQQLSSYLASHVLVATETCMLQQMTAIACTYKCNAKITQAALCHGQETVRTTILSEELVIWLHADDLLRADTAW